MATWQGRQRLAVCQSSKPAATSTVRRVNSVLRRMSYDVAVAAVAGSAATAAAPATWHVCVLNERPEDGS